MYVHEWSAMPSAALAPGKPTEYGGWHPVPIWNFGLKHKTY